MLGRRLVDGTLEVDVAEPAGAALRDDDRLAGFGDVRDQQVRVGVIDLGAERHGDHEVLAALAEHLLSLARLPVLRKHFGS